MTLPRRSFLRQCAAVTGAAAFASPAAHAIAEGPAPAGLPRDFYELRCYRLAGGSRLKQNADPTLLDRYLENAFLPALDRLGISDVGVFTELEVDRRAATAQPRADSPLWLLIPHRTLQSYVHVAASLQEDTHLREAGAAYLERLPSEPAFERIDSWLLLAFKSMPRLEAPAFSRARVPTRVFEMRDYESYSEVKALAKIAMFDQGETELMRSLGMAPVFFGQALAGPDLPHLRYMTGAADLATHLGNWAKFGPDPRWIQMKDLPQFANTVSRNTQRFLRPTSYSQL